MTEEPNPEQRRAGGSSLRKQLLDRKAPGPIVIRRRQCQWRAAQFPSDPFHDSSNLAGVSAIKGEKFERLRMQLD